MNFLFDNNLPAPLAEALRLLNTRTAHVREIRNTGAARGLSSWQIAQLLVRSWDEMERFAERHALPFLALVQRNGRVVKL